MASRSGDTYRLLDPDAGLDRLVRRLIESGFRVIAPVERDGVVVYDEVTRGEDLPSGLLVEQAAGQWRSRHDGSALRFGWTPAADSWKRWFLPPEEAILSVRRRDGSFIVASPPAPSAPLALIGARDCELRALAVLDRVLADAEHPEPRYVARRAGAFVVAVTCGWPAPTCWCTSMGGGPQPTEGFDILLTEVDDTAGHRFVASGATARGQALLDEIGVDPAGTADLAAAAAVASDAAARTPARLDGGSLPSRLEGSARHPHWDDVARRCLSCGNCTLVCPTCFCARVEDRTSLHHAGAEGTDGTVERRQRWASCFELDHSNLAGRPVRATTASRYRQWLTHKLQTWPAQFGTSGCVGCGRCTTWCPAGIDLAEEALELAAPGGSPS